MDISVTDRVSKNGASGRYELETLKGRLTKDRTSASLTEAGLLPDRSARLARLFAEHRNWGAVKKSWHKQRVGGRGTRGSSQKIFRILKARLQQGAGQLPTIIRLAELLEACPSRVQRSQLLYLYLVETDALFRYTLHEVLLAGREEGVWPLDKDRLLDHLDAFEYTDGEPLEYAESTRQRWVEGFRSVLHEIGIRDGMYDDHGSPVLLERIPLLVSAGYSWNRLESDWVRLPMGWSYLFQPAEVHESLFERVSSEPHWQVTNLRTQLQLTPVDEAPFSFDI